jgi:hypothetical protein
MKLNYSRWGAILILLFFSCSQSENRNPDEKVGDTAPLANDLNRNPLHIHYSKHARCRMDCRHIDENEIQDILHTGIINYAKSKLNIGDCEKKYALEGYEKSQHLRIIFAPCGRDVTVVTCIDLSHEWDCHCPGDPH